MLLSTTVRCSVLLEECFLEGCLRCMRFTFSPPPLFLPLLSLRPSLSLSCFLLLALSSFILPAVGKTPLRFYGIVTAHYYGLLYARTCWAPVQNTIYRRRVSEDDCKKNVLFSNINKSAQNLLVSRKREGGSIPSRVMPRIRPSVTVRTALSLLLLCMLFFH